MTLKVLCQELSAVHSSVLCLLSKGCVLKEHVQEALFEVSEEVNNSFLDLAPKCAS